MEFYPDRDIKMALAIQSGMLAKQTAVSELGIGEDLTFSLIGWEKDRMTAIATLAKEYMEEPPEERLSRVAMAATILRKGWGCDALSLLAEAFCSTDYEKTRGRDLRAVFAEKDSPVYECLTVTHVDSEGVSLVTQPYRITVGRKVEWMDPILNTEARGLRDARYPQVLSAILEMEVEKPPYDPEVFYMALAEGLVEDGFQIQWTFE